jgi:hypothetical protein
MREVTRLCGGIEKVQVGLMGGREKKKGKNGMFA